MATAYLERTVSALPLNNHLNRTIDGQQVLCDVSSP
jgi:hypothetical protein